MDYCQYSLKEDERETYKEQQKYVIITDGCIMIGSDMCCGTCREPQDQEMYKCLYCGIYYCHLCAEKHYGQTVKEWYADKLK